MLGRATTLFALGLAILSYLASEPVVYDVLSGLGALLFLPLDIIPLEPLVAALAASPPSFAFLVLFLGGILVFSLAEFGG